MRKGRRRDRRRVDRIGRAARAGIDSLGQTEVENLDRAVRSQLDIGRFQIPVNDAGVVRGFERLGNLAGNRDGFVNRDWSTGDAVGEGVAGHQLHDERARGGTIGRRGFFDPENLGNVRMIQRRQRLRFAREAHHAVGIGREEVGEDLDRDLTIEPRVTCAVNLAHASGAERADDLVVREFGTRPQHSSGHYA